MLILLKFLSQILGWSSSQLMWVFQMFCCLNPSSALLGVAETSLLSWLIKIIYCTNPSRWQVKMEPHLSYLPEDFHLVRLKMLIKFQHQAGTNERAIVFLSTGRESLVNSFVWISLTEQSGRISRGSCWPLLAISSSSIKKYQHLICKARPILRWGVN